MNGPTKKPISVNTYRAPVGQMACSLGDCLFDPAFFEKHIIGYREGYELKLWGTTLIWKKIPESNPLEPNNSDWELADKKAEKLGRFSPQDIEEFAYEFHRARLLAQERWRARNPEAKKNTRKKAPKVTEQIWPGDYKIVNIEMLSGAKKVITRAYQVKPKEEE